MPDNILINFTSDPAGLKPGIDALDQLIAKNKELAVQVKKVADAMEGRDTEVSAASKVAKNDVEGLTTAVTNMGKAAAGGALVTTLRTINLEMGKLAAIKGSNIPFVDNLAARLKVVESISKTTSKSLNVDLPASLEKIKTKTPQATQALTNFGRVVQDAPFGIIGIANNIDPLIESFGRLRAETGSTGGALKAMLGSLAGPAGIGIAISVVTSLLIAFGDELGDLFSDFFPSAERAIEKQKEFNDAIREANSAMVDLSKSYAILYTNRTTDAEKALALAQAQGKSQSTLFTLQQNVNTAKRLENINILANLGLTEEDVKLNETKIELLNEQIQALNSLATAQRPLNDEQKKKIEALQSELSGIKTITDAGRAALTNIKDSATDAQEQTAAFARQTYENSLRSAVALAEARVALAKRGSIEERDAEIAAIRQRVATEKALNVNITPGERAKLEAEAQKQIQDIHFAFQKKALQDSKTGIDAQVLQAKEGTQEEFDLKIQSLELAKQIELKDQELTANKKREITERYYKQALDMARAFNQKQAEISLNTEIASTQTKISELAFSNTEASNAELVELKKKLIDDQAAIEATGVNYSERNEELRLAKIKAIYAKALVEKQDLERKKRSAEISAEFDPREERESTEIDSINRTVSVAGSGQAIIRAAHTLTFEHNKALRDLEAAEDRERLENQEITELEFQRRRIARNDQERRDEEQKEVDRINTKLALEQRFADYVQQLTDVYFSNQQSNNDRDLEENQNRFDKKLITEKEYNDRKTQIEKNQAQQQKLKAVFDIGIELAKTLFQIQAQASILLSNPLTAPLAAQALGQIPFVLAEAGIALAAVGLKKYRHGEVDIDGPGTTTSDSILARISRGESVINANSTSKHRDALEAINNNRFQEYLQMVELPRMLQYQVPQFPAGMERRMESRSAGASIDYNRLGAVIGKQMAANPQMSVHVDQNGLVTMVKNGVDTITYKNKKLNA